MQQHLRSDKQFIVTDLDRKLYRLGVPRKFWKGSSPTFLAHQFRGAKVTAAVQQSWFRVLSQEENPRSRNLLIFAGSYPTDEPAQGIAYSILTNAVQRGQPTAIYEPFGRVKFVEKYPAFVVVDGLTEHSPNEKLDTARYICNQFKYTTRIVTVATQNPGDWLTSALHLHPDLVFVVKDR